MKLSELLNEEEEMTVHARKRFNVRLADEKVFSDEEIKKFNEVVEMCVSQKPRGSAAFRIKDLGKFYGILYGEESNGDELWMVVRDGKVTTLMFRRGPKTVAPQPSTKESLRVDKVIFLPADIMTR